MAPKSCTGCGMPVGEHDNCEVCDDEVCGYCMDDHMEEYHGSGGDEW